MGKRYDLPNRDGLKIWLEQDFENPEKYIFSGEYYSIRYSTLDSDIDNDTHTECSFIDLDGGPFLSLGYKLDEHTEISKIEIDDTKIIITVKEI